VRRRTHGIRVLSISAGRCRVILWDIPSPVDNLL
jgi:hypothetical protein